jgi:hypothetical protein
MTELRLDALSGLNPVGLFAALGTIDGVARMRPGLDVRLSWTDEIIPRAVLSGVGDLDEMVTALDEDRRAWQSSVLLNWGPNGVALDDIKPSPKDARAWVAAVLSGATRVEAEQRLLAGLFAEGAFDLGGKTKPTHFHFTAGQQRFLTMVRELSNGVGPERLEEALQGPWRYDSDLPVLGWDARGDRVYAIRATNPSNDKRLGVPGADWLALTGLSYFPVWASRGKLITTGCSEGWKSGTFTWPLWSRPIPPPVIRSLLRDTSVATSDITLQRERGISQVLRAPIRRTDQGGYGSFGAPEPVLRGLSSSATRVGSRLLHG